MENPIDSNVDHEGNKVPKMDMHHINDALELTRAPLDLRAVLEGDISDGEQCIKASMHGTIHLSLEKGQVDELMGAYLLKELGKDKDPFEIKFAEVTGGKRLALAEQTMDPQGCLDVCFEDLPEERRKELVAKELKSIHGAEQEEAHEEDLYNKLIKEGVGVIEANKTHPNSPFLMARLAAAQGEEGYRQLRIVYPSSPGMPDPEDVAKWLAGGPEPKQEEQNSEDKPQ